MQNRYVIDASQSQPSSYIPSAAGPGAVSWNTHGVDNRPEENGNISNSTYYHEQPKEAVTRTVQDGQNATSLASSSSLAATSASEHNGYTSYANANDPYGYGSSGYSGYYSNYQQQSNHSYPQPVGAYQNTGAPYQPNSSFQNTGSYAGPASYSSTYYSHADYQKAGGGFPSSGYSNQTTTWNEGNYTNYTSYQYPNYAADTNASYSSSTAATNSLQYQQHYKQLADYYSQTEVSCAPGTENLSVASSTSNQVCPVPGVTSGYNSANSQPLPSYASPWQQDSSSSQMPSLQVFNFLH